MHFKPIARNNKRSLLLLVCYLATSVMTGCSSDSNTLPTPTAPPAVETPPESLPDIAGGAAISSVSDDCEASLLCRVAVSSANTMAAHPDNTCYVSENADISSAIPDPNIQLDSDTPMAFTSASGWLQYALTHTEESLENAHSEIDAFRDPQNSWARAWEYHNFFTQIEVGDLITEAWQASSDLNDLQTGDVLSWCQGDWCSGSIESRGSGHVAIVTDVRSIDVSDIKTGLFDIPRDSQFWLVSVVDSSWHIHTSDHTQGAEVLDLRDHAGALNNPNCTNNGGLGAGNIILAQWQDDSDIIRWGYLYYNEANHVFHTALSHAATSVAFARPI